MTRTPEVFKTALILDDLDACTSFIKRKRATVSHHKLALSSAFYLMFATVLLSAARAGTPAF